VFVLDTSTGKIVSNTTLLEPKVTRLLRTYLFIEQSGGKQPKKSVVHACKLSLEVIMCPPCVITDTSPAS
jgi:hypothetical protein